MEKDFIISNNGYYTKIFRFIPENTHVHSFNDNPPKDWKNVYKVYYSWQIIIKDNEDNEEEILLDFVCDECSEIPNLHGIIEHVIKTGETFDYPTFGQPAADWTIKKVTGTDALKEKPYEYYDFCVFNNCSGQGFKFILNKEETLKFCEYLDSINQYALEHGEGI